MPLATLVSSLRTRLAEICRVSADSIVFLDGIDTTLTGIARNVAGSLVISPPSSLAATIESVASMGQSIAVARGLGREGAIELACAEDIPDQSVAIIDSPSDPLGSLLSAVDAVRLARACSVLVIDERNAVLSGTSMLPLAAEFDNIVVLRSLETWTGAAHESCPWAVASPRSAELLGLQHATLSPEAVATGLAAMDNVDSIAITLRNWREERSRLFRLLRKLSYLEPVPSWGPFLAARVNIVEREAVVTGLMARRIRIHVPNQIGLERFIRIGIGSRPMMERLKWALLDLGPELMR
ncbi:MAG: hypothetical protein H0T18_08610 [Chloroflexia bacterium]|nr:hypothetical protein [Chloroflexia bacterium]